MKIKILFLVLIFFIVSCDNDTCNEVVGETFTEITYVNTVNNQSGNVLIKLNLSTNSKLPSNYFDNVTISNLENNPAGDTWHNSFQAFDSVKFTKTEALLYLKNQYIQDNFNKLEFALHLIFPDRINYIDCAHPQENDIYMLDISFDIINIDNINYNLNNFKWEETLYKGGF